jgi:hypothetical protein
MAAQLLALRGVYVDGRIVSAGDTFTCPDDIAADLLNSGKAEPADASTRKRVKKRGVAWAEGSPEMQAARPGWNARLR